MKSTKNIISQSNEIEDEYKNFAKMVKCAENYIKNNAKKILVAVRKSKKADYKVNKSLLEDYKPKLSKDDITKIKNKYSYKIFKKIIEHFCHELQNYRYMPRIINYNSYNEKNSNVILTIVLDFIKENLKEDKKKAIPDKREKEKIFEQDLKLYSKFKENNDIQFEEKKEFITSKKNNEKYIKDFCEKQNNKYNDAWLKYCKGIVDILISINKEGGEKEFTNYIINKCEKFDYEKEKYEGKIEDFIKDIQKEIKEFSDRYTGIGETMAYDFFKELYCKYLIKDDTHIQECYKKISNNSEDIRKNFLKWCLRYNLKHKNCTPYYIDKILWLCCTGNFYKDNITINAMTRNRFFKDYEKK